MSFARGFFGISDADIGSAALSALASAIGTDGYSPVKSGTTVVGENHLTQAEVDARVAAVGYADQDVVDLLVSKGSASQTLAITSGADDIEGVAASSGGVSWSVVGFLTADATNGAFWRGSGNDAAVNSVLWTATAQFTTSIDTGEEISCDSYMRTGASSTSAGRNYWLGAGAPLIDGTRRSAAVMRIVLPDTAADDAGDTWLSVFVGDPPTDSAPDSSGKPYIMYIQRPASETTGKLRVCNNWGGTGNVTEVDVTASGGADFLMEAGNEYQVRLERDPGAAGGDAVTATVFAANGTTVLATGSATTNLPAALPNGTAGTGPSSLRGSFGVAGANAASGPQYLYIGYAGTRVEVAA